MENPYAFDESAGTKAGTRRVLCMRVAAAIATAMADTGKTFAQIDGELGWSHGGSRTTVLTLLNGRTVSLERLADIAFALGCGIHVIVQPDH